MDSGKASLSKFNADVDNGKDSYSDDGSLSKPASAPTMGVFSGITLCAGAMIGAGIFATPDSVYAELNSTATSIIFWAVGGIAALLGACVYIELGCIIPKNGGEQAYLSYIFKRPREFWPYMFCWQNLVCFLPGAISATATVFGKHILIPVYGATMHSDYETYMGRLVSCAGMTAVIALNMVSTKWTLRLMSILTSFKFILLTAAIISGLVIWAGGHKSTEYTGNINADQSFKGTESANVNNYCNALYMVLWAFSGWNNLHTAPVK